MKSLTSILRTAAGLLPLALALAAPAPAQELLISSYNGDQIHRHDPVTGALLGRIPGVPGAQSLRYGPDGHLYAVAEKANRVLRFDGATGAPLGALVADDPLTPADETGGLSGPTAAVFGPGGDLFVASFNNDRVLRYDGTTGAFLETVVGSGTALNGPDAGMVFGPDGLLYVPGFFSNAIHRYDTQTGATLAPFVSAGAGGLSRPRMLRFRSDGWLYVTSWGNAGLKRYDASGQFVDTLLTTNTPTGFVFETGTNHLLVCSDNQNNVRRFDATTGALLAVLVPKGTGGLSGATYLEYLPHPALTLERVTPGLAGAVNTLVIRGATPSGVVLFGAGLQPASTLLPLAAPTYLGVGNPIQQTLPSDGAGRVELAVPLDPAFAGVTLYMQAYDPPTQRISNLVVQTF